MDPWIQVKLRFSCKISHNPIILDEDKIQRHTVTGKTGEAVDLGDFSEVSGDKGTLIKLHASFMVLAWLLCANLGTFTARYCKDIFTVSRHRDMY